MNEQKIFEKALKHYEAAEKNLAELVDTVSEFLPDYPALRAFQSFDFLLQGMLLRQSLADGSMDRNEVAFIKGIVNTGDLLFDVKERLKASVADDLLAQYTWENVYLAPVELQTMIVNALNEYAAPAVEETAFLCAVADAVTKKNYYKYITRAVCGILTCFAKIDGKSTAEEIDEGCLSYVEGFARCYLGVKNFTENLIKEGEAWAKAAKRDWKALQKQAKKAIDSLSPAEVGSLLALLEGDLSQSMIEIVTEG